MVSTITTIDGERVTLDADVAYLVRPREGEDLVGRFVERTKNGSLRFAVLGGGPVVLRPKDVLAIGEFQPVEIPKATEPGPFGATVVSTRRADETASAYLDRIEAGLGASYTRWIETGPGQDALEAARREATSARSGRTKRSGLATEDVLVAPPTGPAPDLTPAEEAHLLGEESLPVDAPLPVDLASKTRGTAKPYAERNQVWRCSECKRRTRAPSCSNGHAEVLAPAGKRRADRG